MRTRGGGDSLWPRGHIAPSLDSQVLVWTPAGDNAASEFAQSVHFQRFGRLPTFLAPLVPAPSGGEAARERRDGVLWVTALHSNELVEYTQPPAAAAAADDDGEEVPDSALLDLLAADLPSRRVKKMPKWARDCLLQFVLPFGIVFAVFAISYLLVLLGPLKGIGDAEWLKPPPHMQRDYSGTHPPEAPTPTPLVGVHEFDSPDEYDEL